MSFYLSITSCVCSVADVGLLFFKEFPLPLVFCSEVPYDTTFLVMLFRELLGGASPFPGISNEG